MSDSDPAHDLLSVVIIGLNEGGRIGRCIDSVRRATADFPDCQVVYVDSGSTDASRSEALAHGARVFQLGSSQRPSPAAGRFVGSQVTTGRFVMFVDGDSVLAGGWVKAAVDAMLADETIVMLAGRAIHDPTFDPANLADVDDLGELRSVRMVGGGSAPIYRRAALEQAGNWNPFIAFKEEEDLGIRLRHFSPWGRILQSNRAAVFSPMYPMSPWEILRRWRRGFVRGPGQILRNGLKGGYWRECLNQARFIILCLFFYFGLAAACILNLWWQFLVFFFGLAALRALARRRAAVFFAVFYSLLAGPFSLWEFLSTPVRGAGDYRLDFREVIGPDGDDPGSRK